MNYIEQESLVRLSIMKIEFLWSQNLRTVLGRHDFSEEISREQFFNVFE